MDGLESIVRAVVHWVAHYFGYDDAVRLEDCLTFASGFIFGGWIVSLLIHVLFKNSVIDREMDDAACTILEINGKSKIVVNVRTLRAYYLTLTILFFHRLGLIHGTRVSYATRATAKILTWSFFAVSVLLAFVGLLLCLTVVHNL